MPNDARHAADSQLSIPFGARQLSPAAKRISTAARVKWLQAEIGKTKRAIPLQEAMLAIAVETEAAARPKAGIRYLKINQARRLISVGLEGMTLRLQNMERELDGLQIGGRGHG